ncbi:MAG: beta-galactosidase trimerization domain-containing protein [Victivallales bacterium]
MQLIAGTFNLVFCGLCMGLLFTNITTAGEKPAGAGQYEVYEEKITEDTPLQPWQPDRKVSYIWVTDKEDCNAVCRKAKSVGLNTIGWGSKEITSICKGERNTVSVKRLKKVLPIVSKNHMGMIVLFNFNGARNAEKSGNTNLLNKGYNERLFRLLDAIAEESKKYGNTTVYFDEIWCNEGRHSHKNDIDSFKSFCKREYGENYPGSIMPPRMNPGDKWWRRYVVFKNCIYENFCKRLLDYAHKKGLKIENRMYPSYQSSSGWKWGMDSYRISKLADYNQTWFWSGFEGDYYENSLMGAYKDPRALSMALYLKGYPLQYFCYGYLVKNPWVGVKIPEMAKQAKIWEGAKRKAEICILNYPVALIGLFGKKSPDAYTNNDEVFERLSRYFETDRTDVRNTRFFKNYKVLIIPKYSACSIPGYACKGLLDFAKNGGTIIISDAAVGIGKRDLTNPRNMLPEIAGTKPVWQGKANGQIKIQGRSMAVKNINMKALETGKAKTLATYKGKPVITEYKLGRGYVVYTGFNLAELMKDNSKWLEILKDIIMKYYCPAVLSDGKINVESVIKKGNRALISLYPATDTGSEDASNAALTDQMGDLPSTDKEFKMISGNLSMDTAKLGLSGNSFQVFSVTHCKIVKNKTGEEVWTPSELKRGAAFKIDGRAGYENLIIEPPGTVHTEKSLIDELANIDKEIKERIAEGKAHPQGLNQTPFTVKSVSVNASYKTAKPWAAANNYRLPFYIENSSEAARRNEPVIIKWKDLLKGFGSPIKRNSLSLYRINGDKQEPVLCQVTGSGASVSNNDEIIFTDDFAAGHKNEYILYFGNNPASQKNRSGIVIAKKGKNLKVSNGILSAEIQPKTWMVLADEKTGKPVLRLNGAGGRYEGLSYQGSGKFNWKEKGSAYCCLEIKTSHKGTTFVTTYEFFNNSPYVVASYSSSQATIKMDDWSYRPSCTLLGPTSSAEALVASGWGKIGSNDLHGVVPMRNNVGAIVKQQGTAPFGWLLAASDIPEHPHLLLSKRKNKGSLIIEFAKHHCAFIPQWKPQVSWIYIHNISTEKEIDNCAKAIGNPLPVVTGKIENGKK